VEYQAPRKRYKRQGIKSALPRRYIRSPLLGRCSRHYLSYQLRKWHLYWPCVCLKHQCLDVPILRRSAIVVPRAVFKVVFMERQLRRRRRPALSCFECRRRKIKCDRNDRCAHCVSTNTQCVYNVSGNDLVTLQQLQQQSSQHGASAYTTSPLAQAQRTSTNRPTTEQAEHRTTNWVTTPTAGILEPAPALTPVATNDIHIPTPNRVQNAEPDLGDILRRIQTLEDPSAFASAIALQDSPLILNKERIFKWSHWLGTGQEV
jgi:hypothetical protein